MRRAVSTLSLLLLLLPASVPAARPARPRLVTSPQRLTLRLGEGRQLRARLSGREGVVEWSVAGAACGSVTPTGFYVAPSQALTPATIRVLAEVGGDPPLQAETLVFLEPVGVTVSPRVVSLATAQTAQFRAEIQGTDDRRVRWTVEGGTGQGQITPTGLYTAPPRFLTPGTVTIRAASVADPSKSATATVRIGSIAIQVTPPEVSLLHGRSQKFQARISGTPNTAVEWKVLGEGQGEISPAGIYTPPLSMATPAVVTLLASSVADPTKTATARIRVQPVTISAGPLKKGKKGKVSPRLVRGAGHAIRSTVRRVTRLYLPFNPLDLIVQGPLFRGKSGKQYVPLGGAVPLDATVSNTTNDRVQWEIEGQPIGEINGEGFYEAPETLTTPQVVQIRATSVADTTKSVVYTLHIPPVVVRAQERAATCPLDGAIQLRARVENAENDRTLWSVEGGEKYGTVSETGLYHPPAQIVTPAVVRVRAASAADPTKFAIIQVDIPEVRLEVSPGEAELRPGQVLRLKARARGCTGTGEVTWKLTPEIGSISPDGVYQAPASGGPQAVQVTASLKSDPTKIAIVTLRIRKE